MRKVGEEVVVKERVRWFYNAPAGVMLSADPKYLEKVLMPATAGVIDSIEDEDKYGIVYIVKVGNYFHRVYPDEIRRDRV